MEVYLSPGDFVLDGDPALPSPKRGCSPSPIFVPCLLWPNGWMDQHGTSRRVWPWSRPHCARWGPSSPPQKGGRAPSRIFGPFLFWPNDWMHQDSTWYEGRPQSKRLCVRWGPRKGAERPPQFSAHVYCCQTAGWIKMALRVEVGLGPGHTVLDWDPAHLPKKEADTPIFGPYLLGVAKRLYVSVYHLVRR